MEQRRIGNTDLVSCPGSSQAKSGDGFEDLIGGFGPDEGFRIFVFDFDELSDLRLELERAAKGTPSDLLRGERGKPALDQIDP